MINKFILLTLFFSYLLLSCNNSNEKGSLLSENVSTDVAPYDSIKAKELGADQYGMRPYVLALLKKGPNRDLTEDEASTLQRAHMDNISKLAKEGKLVLAGPFLSDGDLRGIYIFNTTTIEDAKLLVETDPAIQQGSLIMELLPWYGSAALIELNEIHEQITKVKF